MQAREGLAARRAGARGAVIEAFEFDQGKSFYGGVLSLCFPFSAGADRGDAQTVGDAQRFEIERITRADRPSDIIDGGNAEQFEDAITQMREIAMQESPASVCGFIKAGEWIAEFC